MGRLFGTDGVRGRANADLTPELAMSIAVAAAHVLGERDRTHPPVAVVGRDPRASGEMLEAAVVAGLASTGAIVVRVGVLPTPGVAYLVGETRADFGVMISASHNPMPDNGIKLFAAGGQKLPDDIENEIEAAVAHGIDWTRPTGVADRARTRPARRRRRVRRAPAGQRPEPARRASRSSSTARTAPRPRSPRPSTRRPAPRSIAIHADAGRPQHQRRLRLHAPRQRPGGGPRARRRTSASRTTATPTACLAVTADGDGRRRRRDHGDPGARDARRGHAEPTTRSSRP